MTSGQLFNDPKSFINYRRIAMNAPQKILVDTETELQMQAALKAQRESYIAEGEVSAATRIDRIDRAVDVLLSIPRRSVRR